MTAEMVPTGSKEDGNTDSSSMKVKRPSPCLKYCFTWNNYKEEDLVPLVTSLETLCKKFIFQEEISESGTPHLQGSIWLKTKKRITALKKIDKNIHWEKMRNETASIAYCQKSDTKAPGGRVWQIGFAKPLKDPLEGKELYDFQSKILEMIKHEPDDRKVYWFYDLAGCKGKTTLAKHICMNYNALYVQGKAADIKYGVIDMINKRGEIDIVIMGLPRSYEQYVSYDAIESIKDGIFYSSKYESGMCMFNIPHVIILSNFRPEEAKLSADRWVIECLDDFEYVENQRDLDATCFSP